MKAKRLFLAMAMVVFAIGSASAQEKSAVKKLNDDGTVNKDAVLTKEELRLVETMNLTIGELTGQDRVNRLKEHILSADNQYMGDDAMIYTKLTREEVVKQGFPEIVFDFIERSREGRNKSHREDIERVGPEYVGELKKAFERSMDNYHKSGRQRMVDDINATLKQMETEKAK